MPIIMVFFVSHAYFSKKAEAMIQPGFFYDSTFFVKFGKSPQCNKQVNGKHIYPIYNRKLNYSALFIINSLAIIVLQSICSDER